MSESVTRRFLITGRVQGVYFRHSTRIEAERLGITGIARNLADGTVEVIALGSVSDIDLLCSWLRHGPPTARVATVEEVSVEQTPLGEPGRIAEKFAIK